MTYREEKVECSSTKVVISCDEPGCEKSGTFLDANRSEVQRMIANNGWTYEATPLGVVYRCQACTRKRKDK